jgi:hypothetical protein
MTSYTPTNTAALRRPLEPGQYTSLAFGRWLRQAGLIASMGSIATALTTP